MISDNELIAAIGPLDKDALLRWIDLGWIVPARERQELRFDVADVARVRLIPASLMFDL